MNTDEIGLLRMYLESALAQLRVIEQMYPVARVDMPARDVEKALNLINGGECPKSSGEG